MDIWWLLQQQSQRYVLVINEAGGIITITGTTSDAQISDILVGYELADGTEGRLSGVTVGGDATSGFTVPNLP